jgi:hypothetical protein
MVEEQDRESLFSRIRDQLMGSCFSTAKDRVRAIQRSMPA